METIRINDCSACGKTHLLVPVHKTPNQKPEHVQTHYCFCPESGAKITVLTDERIQAFEQGHGE